MAKICIVVVFLFTDKYGQQYGCIVCVPCPRFYTSCKTFCFLFCGDLICLTKEMSFCPEKAFILQIHRAMALIFSPEPKSRASTISRDKHG